MTNELRHRVGVWSMPHARSRDVQGCPFVPVEGSSAGETSALDPGQCSRSCERALAAHPSPSMWPRGSSFRCLSSLVPHNLNARRAGFSLCISSSALETVRARCLLNEFMNHPSCGFKSGGSPGNIFKAVQDGCIAQVTRCWDHYFQSVRFSGFQFQYKSQNSPSLPLNFSLCL